MAAVTSAVEQCGNGETPLAFLRPEVRIATRPGTPQRLRGCESRSAAHRERLNYYTDDKRIRLLA